jgi:hypothetical protein
MSCFHLSCGARVIFLQPGPSAQSRKNFRFVALTRSPCVFQSSGAECWRAASGIRAPAIRHLMQTVSLLLAWVPLLAAPPVFVCTSTVEPCALGTDCAWRPVHGPCEHSCEGPMGAAEHTTPGGKLKLGGAPRAYAGRYRGAGNPMISATNLLRRDTGAASMSTESATKAARRLASFFQ